jgi:hypothetical protein
MYMRRKQAPTHVTLLDLLHICFRRKVGQALYLPIGEGYAEAFLISCTILIGEPDKQTDRINKHLRYMEFLKRLYWRIYYRVFGIVADQVRPDAQAPAGRISRKDWREMVLHEAKRDAEGVGRLDAYACLVCKRIFVTVQQTHGMTFYRTPCLNCPKVRQVGKLSFPNPIAFATSYWITADKPRRCLRSRGKWRLMNLSGRLTKTYLRDTEPGRRNLSRNRRLSYSGESDFEVRATFANVDLTNYGNRNQKRSL